MKLGLDFGGVVKSGGDVDGARSAIGDLRQRFFGPDIFLISRVGEGGEAKNRAWLRDNGFEHLIPPHQQFYVSERKDKAPIASMLSLTHFVDDRPEVLAHMTTVYYPFAFKPTDDDLARHRTTFPGSRIIIARTWKELVYHIEDTRRPPKPEMPGIKFNPFNAGSGDIFLDGAGERLGIDEDLRW